MADDLEHYYKIYAHAVRLGMSVPPMELWDAEPDDNLKFAWCVRDSDWRPCSFQPES